jgi:sec-independent protein translocase protein TatA
VLNGFGWPHLLIIAALIIILFGAKRLPDAARGIGKSMRIFRAETRGMQDDEASAAPQAPPQQLAAPQQYAQPPQQPYVAPQQQYAPPPQQPYVAPVADQVPAPKADQQH